MLHHGAQDDDRYRQRERKPEALFEVHDHHAVMVVAVLAVAAVVMPVVRRVAAGVFVHGVLVAVQHFFPQVFFGCFYVIFSLFFGPMVMMVMLRIVLHNYLI
ncbi:hypothetical protein [Pontibacter sp. SGAir0037]|uniref:hypothetical protein n=1 Tax=Pontibacter sp. SGAir0037 TaxID=2571030 RepID=UPI00352AC6E0